MKKFLAIFSCLGVDPETDKNADFSRQKKCEKMCIFCHFSQKMMHTPQRGLH